MAEQRDLRGMAAAEMQLLQRLKQALPEAGEQELAALLQLEIRPVSPSAKPRWADEPESPKCPLPPIGPDTRNKVIDYPPADKTLPFLYLHAIEQKEPQADTAQEPDWYPRIQPFDGAIVSAMAPPQDPESLLPWQQLWPVA